MTGSSVSSLWPLSRAGGCLTIDLDAIVANYRLLSARLASGTCAAVVKADAYGLGLAQVAPALERAGARDFFVAHVDEGIALRPLLSAETRITVLHGPRPDAVADCVAYGLRPVLNSLEQMAWWRDHAGVAGQRFEVALQVDSGMSRFGLSARDVATVAADSRLLEGVDVGLVMSHLACADEPLNPASAVQQARFMELAAQLPRAPLSLAASSGIFLGGDYHFDMVRPGAALYGLAPNSEAQNPLLPVVRLQGRVLQIRDLQPGDGVGYGLTYRASEVRRAAVVAVGYADGFFRHGAAEGCAWFEEIRLPLLGRVSMDSLIVDVSDIPEGRLSADMMVDLIGSRRSVDDVARAAGTIGYEVLTALGHRYARSYVGGM